MQLKLQNVLIKTHDIRNISVTKQQEYMEKGETKTKSSTGYYGNLTSAIKAAADDLPWSIDGKLTLEKLLAAQELFCQDLATELERLNLSNSKELYQLANQSASKIDKTVETKQAVQEAAKEVTGIDWG